MWWKINRRISSLLTIVIALLFINNGSDRLIQMALDQKDEYSIFKYMHSIEIVIIGLFFLLIECNSPLFKENVNIMYKPTPKSFLILIFSVFLYAGTDNGMDFYLVCGMGTFMLIISFYTKRPRKSLENIL
jgi:hypothetical protein